MFYGLVTVVQYLTGVFCPAGDLSVLVTVVQYLTHVLWPGDCGSVSDWCLFVLQEISLFWSLWFSI